MHAGRTSVLQPQALAHAVQGEPKESLRLALEGPGLLEVAREEEGEGQSLRLARSLAAVSPVLGLARSKFLPPFRV